MKAVLPPKTSAQVDYQHSEIPALSHPTSKVRHYYNLFTYYGTLIWENVVIAILAIQSLHALYTATKFIIDDYPTLDALAKQGLLNSGEVTHILTEAIGLMIGTIINILFAIRLSRAQERISRIFELIAGTALIIWYQPLIELLTTLNYSYLTQWLHTIPLGL